MARRVLVVQASLEHAARHELPLSRRVSDVVEMLEAPLELVEARAAVQRISHDQHAPEVARVLSSDVSEEHARVSVDELAEARAVTLYEIAIRGSRRDIHRREPIPCTSGCRLGYASRGYARAGVTMTTEQLQSRLLAWFSENGRDLPWRETRDPYAILVCEIMLQQTQVARVIERCTSWLERWPTVEALAGCEHRRRPARLVGPRLQPARDQPAARRARRGRGTGRSRARSRDCGRYRESARTRPRAIACFAFGAQLTTVDVNVRRVLTRALEREDAPPPARTRLGVEPGALRSRRDRLPRARPALRGLPARGRAAPRAARASSRCASRGRSPVRRAHAAPRWCATCTTGRARHRSTMPRRSTVSNAMGCWSCATDSSRSPRRYPGDPARVGRERDPLPCRRTGASGSRWSSTSR